MKTVNNISDCSDNPFFKAERLEINIRPMFLPLFFKQTETAKNTDVEKPHVMERILENVEVLFGGYLKDDLTDMKFDLEGEYDIDFYTKGKFKAAVGQFARQIFDTYYDPAFETLQPTEELQSGREVYDQFKGNPTKAAHFLVHKYYETGELLNIVCTNVAQITIPDKNIQIDFTFVGFNEGNTGFRMMRRHLHYFRIFKKYAKKGRSNEWRLRNLMMDKMRAAKDVDFDFEYCLEMLKNACLRGCFWDRHKNQLIYADERHIEYKDAHYKKGRKRVGTGWSCGFLEKEKPNTLELIFLCNVFIDGEFIDITFSKEYYSYVKLKDYVQNQNTP